ncbi:unnamed protein product [Arabidopsis arenosa]|uniref:Uncharacterized protein n=1 Tax=Arabidopsis arenosa TaxID=38785 RepID=A0A8S2AYP6_ARAAE|nr:unnamed protein product [Arabidopsis arenosa]
MVSSGQPTKEYIDAAVRHVLLRQGVLGLKKIVYIAPAQVVAPTALVPEAPLTTTDYPAMPVA